MTKRAKRRGGKSAGTRYPKLGFGPATSWSGFTPTGVSGFNDLQPGVVVRELLQNALDAAVAAGESTAIVHFAVRTVRTADIPGCDEYRDALGSAVESQTRRSVNGTLPDNAQQVVDTITAALDRDTCSVLVILDNGIGLDATSMDALLSDGTSAKQDAATGSYGNGHMVAIPASDLRYVLYGGVKQDATRIGAGHAVLASHTRAGDGHHRDADGYLVRSFGGGGEGHLYDYAAGKAVPPLIQRELDIIAERWGHGTAIVVPAFNSFREQRTTLWDLVSLSAACSFFAAVHHGRLRIEVAEPGTGSVRVLDSETVAAVLEYHKERKRRRSRSALSGARAFGAWETLKTGSRHALTTKLGTMAIHLRHPAPSGMIRVDLCRNGMWIVDRNDIPGFYGKFADRQPFDAVLLVDADTGGEAHRLIRKAEGPLHNNLSAKLLSKREAKDLRALLEAIRERIEGLVPEVGADTYSPDDVLTLEAGGVDGPGAKSGRMSLWGMPVEVGRRALAPVLQQESGGDDKPESTPLEKGGSGKRPSRGGAGHKQSSRTLQRISSVAVLTGVGSCAVQLRCAHDTEDAELSLRVDENNDVTCDHLWADERVHIRSAKQAGKSIARKDFVLVDGQPVAVRLRALSAGQDYRVDVQYEVPDSASIAGIRQPVLRVELVRRPVASAGASH